MITVITTTHGRPLCFSLLEGWMKLQTLQPNQWLVVTDESDGYRFTMGQDIIFRKYKEGENSLRENWLAAIPHVKKDHHVVVCEDDEFYASNYLEVMGRYLCAYDVIGISKDLYFNLYTRKFRRCHNLEHSSLAGTAFDNWCLPIFQEVCEQADSVFLDMDFWYVVKKADVSHFLIENEAYSTRAAISQGKPTVLKLGMKGMPGARGLGLGHDESGSSDQSLQTLDVWVGREASRIYRGIPRSAWGRP